MVMHEISHVLKTIRLTLCCFPSTALVVVDDADRALRASGNRARGGAVQAGCMSAPIAWSTQPRMRSMREMRKMLPSRDPAAADQQGLSRVGLRFVNYARLHQLDRFGGTDTPSGLIQGTISPYAIYGVSDAGAVPRLYWRRRASNRIVPPAGIRGRRSGARPAGLLVTTISRASDDD